MNKILMGMTMKTNWLVTPYFFDQYDPALAGAAPEGSLVNGPYDVPDRSPSSLARVHVPILDFVKNALNNNALPISIAGDCAGSIPVMAGLQSVGISPILIWLDAHADFNTPKTSPTQFLGGMPMAMMVGRGDQEIARNVGLIPVKEEDVWLVGARDIDPLEQIALDASKVNRLEMMDLEKMLFERPIHLHLDIDVLDSAEAPANNYPVQGGPSVAELIESSTRFIKKNNVVAISFSGWNSLLDKDGRTCDISSRILASFVAATE